VTFSDDGNVDVVSEVAKNTLAAHKESSVAMSVPSSLAFPSEATTDGGPEKNDGDNTNDSSNDTKRKKKRWVDANVLHGKVAQSLGGVSRGGEVTHFVDAHYLWTPDQHKRHLEQEKRRQQQEDKTATHDEAFDDEDEDTSDTTSTTNTRSSVAAHSMSNYLMGISRESGPEQHPLVPGVPPEWLELLAIGPAIASERKKSP